MTEKEKSFKDIFRAIFKSVIDSDSKEYFTRCPHQDPVVEVKMGIGVCQACKDIETRMEAAFKKGVEIEYADGSKEMYKLWSSPRDGKMCKDCRWYASLGYDKSSHLAAMGKCQHLRIWAAFSDAKDGNSAAPGTFEHYYCTYFEEKDDGGTGST